MEALFGKSLLTKSGVDSTKDTLNSKGVVALYFSAHWSGTH
jgi:hypothetical protein